MTAIGENTTGHSVALPGRDGEVIELAWAAETDTGHRRQHNEDSYVVSPPLFAVADGMGGHSAGDLASDAVVTRIAEAATGDFAEEDVIERALRKATKDITRVADEAHLGVGTTATGASLRVIDGQPFWSVFNVGDSRVYLAEGGELSQVTVDHSVVQELVDAGMITAEAAEHHPDSNIITRAVGFNADAVPDYWLLPLRTGMRLLLCSDGLSKELDSARIREILCGDGTVAQVAEELVLRALDAGGRDNVTVVVIEVVAAPQPEPGAESANVADDAQADSDEEADEEGDTIPRRPASGAEHQEEPNT
ncbi:protein phosphatase [Homoserinimonas aerilata]|uniref:Protein phosphatase n=1 Tax=Homoserinimonas aerilata TaxID=1162970 RepID=A0A542YK89_9MICO|nr:protein phosphatase 2C domain-containing protein [Homoserinimonas aerilata]TQL48490.1 protein phosphatase [Homoserinimonas aerilata]